ncbi:MAG: hypothetical protein U0003_04735 [Vampirovibrionales bacterium]
MTLLNELPEALSYFFGTGVSIPSNIYESVIAPSEGQTVLQFVLAQLQQNTLDISSLEAASHSIKQITTALAPLKTKAILWPIRAAISGRTHGADLNACLFYLGKERFIHRLQVALNFSKTKGV